MLIQLGKFGFTSSEMRWLLAKRSNVQIQPIFLAIWTAVILNKRSNAQIYGRQMLIQLWKFGLTCSEMRRLLAKQSNVQISTIFTRKSGQLILNKQSNVQIYGHQTLIQRGKFGFTSSKMRLLLGKRSNVQILPIFLEIWTAIVGKKWDQMSKCISVKCLYIIRRIFDLTFSGQTFKFSLFSLQSGQL